MINVPKATSPKVTEAKAKKARVDMRENGHAKKIKELRAKKSLGQNNFNDRETLLAMILADEEIPAASDIDSQITTEMLNWEATHDAGRLLKRELEVAQREANTAALLLIKPEHDAVMKRLVTALAEVVTPAWIELFKLSRDLRDRDMGYQCGVCDLLPTDLLGVPNAHSPLAAFLQAAVAAGYLKTLPREFRV